MDDQRSIVPKENSFACKFVLASKSLVEFDDAFVEQIIFANSSYNDKVLIDAVFEDFVGVSISLRNQALNQYELGRDACTLIRDARKRASGREYKGRHSPYSRCSFHRRPIDRDEKTGRDPNTDSEIQLSPALVANMKKIAASYVARNLKAPKKSQDVLKLNFLRFRRFPLFAPLFGQFWRDLF